MVRFKSSYHILKIKKKVLFTVKTCNKFVSQKNVDNVNKLAYLSMCQLYLSQILIYDFNHNLLNKKYGSKT